MLVGVRARERSGRRGPVAPRPSSVPRTRIVEGFERTSPSWGPGRIGAGVESLVRLLHPAAEGEVTEHRPDREDQHRDEDDDQADPEPAAPAAPAATRPRIGVLAVADPGGGSSPASTPSEPGP